MRASRRVGTVRRVRRRPQPLSRDHETIGALLQRDRLERRRHRLEGVVAALRARARVHGADGRTVPRPLAASLTDFQQQLAAVRRELAEGEVPGEVP